MKCIHCGSQWTSTTPVTKCPFCGKSLASDTDAPKTMLSALTLIRQQQGEQALGNGKRLASIFKDLAPELKKEYTLLSYLEKCDGVQELYLVRGKTEQEQDSAVAKVVCRMADELMISQDAAQLVCDTYMQALTGRKKGPKPMPKQVIPPVAPPKPPVTQPKPAAPQSSPQKPEFEIDQNGTLLKYNGSGGNVRIPANVKTIGGKVFDHNQRINQVEIPESVLGIGMEAFASCQNLKRVTFPSTLRSVGVRAFWACSALEEVTLPGSAKNLDKLAFWACRKLKKLTLQEGITELVEDVFNYCDGLQEIHLPKSLQKVHIHAFTGATGARIYGNTDWIMKDGHVVRRTNAESPKPPVTPPKASETPPKPPVTPPKPPVTPPKPPVTPPKPAAQTTTTAKTTGKTKPPIMRFFSFLFFPTWILMYYCMAMGIKFLGGIMAPGNWILVLVLLLCQWGSRKLFKNGFVFWGFVATFFSVGFSTMFFFTETPYFNNSDVPTTILAVLCAITSFCHGPIFDKSK